MVERRRERRRPWLDQRRRTKLRGYELYRKPRLSVLSQQGLPVPSPAAQLLRELRARNNRPGSASARRGRIHEPGENVNRAEVQPELRQLRQADRVGKRAPRLHERD